MTYDANAAAADSMDLMPAEEKVYSKDTVKKCAATETCYEYTVTADMTGPAQDDEDGNPTDDMSGTMDFSAQLCIDSEDAEADISGYTDAICDEWNTALTEELDSDDLSGVVTGITSTCGDLTACGDDCVDEDDISGAVTFGLSALFVSFTYMMF